jgi:glycosyltransferase involved in cell wall biosynthesis
MKINLISHDNGVGLTQDVAICKRLLSGHECKFVEIKSNQVPEKADINIFFELLNDKFYPFAKYNLFFPNPEWFWSVKMLKGLNLVLCKTRDAENIFTKLGCQTVYTSYTSRDMRDKTPKVRQYIHLAGKSSNKGTNAVFQTWNGRDLPDLIFCKADKYDQFKKHTDNIKPVWGRMKEEDLKYLMNSSLFHVCPSEYEGFGHYIWEAKSTGGIVITTNGAPMSDFVRDSIDGFTVKSDRRSSQSLGILHHVSVKGLEETIRKTMILTESELSEMSRQSRAMWEDNDRYFKQIFKLVIDEIVK